MAVYRPPNHLVPHVSDFLNKLDEVLNNVCQLNILLYIIGDFNFNLKDNNNRVVIKYINIVHSYGLQIIDNNTITRIKTGTCLDHVIVNDSKSNIHLQYVDYDIFDHRLLFIEIIDSRKNDYSKNSENAVSDSLLIEKVNYDGFRISLQNHAISVNCRENVSNSYNEFIKNLQKNLSDNKYNLNIKSKINDKPWLTSAVTRLIATKNYWYAKMIKDKNNSKLKKEYTYWANKCTYVKRNSKSEYFKNKFENSIHSNKLIWKNINEVINDGAKTHNKLPLLKDI